jgi:CRP-like cAMP-binding protein
MSVLDGSRRVATVTAITAMTLLVMNPQELDALLAEVPTVARRMLAAVGARLRLADRALSRQGQASPLPPPIAEAS